MCLPTQAGLTGKATSKSLSPTGLCVTAFQCCDIIMDWTIWKHLVLLTRSQDLSAEAAGFNLKKVATQDLKTYQNLHWLHVDVSLVSGELTIIFANISLGFL